MNATAWSELVIARHGHAHCNDTRTIAGPGCTGLTETGRAQARALADRLRREGGIGEIHASTTRRAWETATLIADILDVPVREQHQLRVPDPGEAEGRQWSAARDAYPIDPDNPVRPIADGGERWTDYLARAAAALTAILNTAPGGRVLVVGHSETAAAAFAMSLGTNQLGKMKVRLDCAGITRWRPADEYPGVRTAAPRWELVSHNDTSHLTK